MSEPVSPRLLETFVEEVEDQVRQLNRDLLALESGDEDPETLRSLFRAGHTIKGAARVVGVPGVERVCHAFEALFAAAREGVVNVVAHHFPLLFATADALGGAAEALRRKEPLEEDRLARIAELLQAAARGDAPDPGAVEGVAAPLEPRPAPPSAEAAAPPPGAGEAEPPTRGAPAPEAKPVPGDEDAEDDWSHVRIRAAKLDSLLATTMELTVTSGRAERAATEVSDLHRRLDRWMGHWRSASEELRAALRRGGAPLAVHGVLRDLEEGLHVVAREAGRIAQEAGDDARRLDRTSDELSHAVRRLRTRPVGDAFESLPRAVRDVAATEGREVELVLSGEDVEADRLVVDTLREPLLHLVRNAVSHGIETPDERTRGGKPETGTVRVTAQRLGDRIVVTVLDDGRGLDIAEARRQLQQMGVDDLGDDQAVVRALFSGGVSTRSEASEISGRGVGLNLVDAAMDRIRGHVDVTWTPGQGTRFELVCPPSPSALRAVLVSVDHEILALPTWSVSRLVRVRRDDVVSIEGRPYLRQGAGHLRLLSLADVLGPPLEASTGGDWITAVVVEENGGGAALLVDAVLEERELVMRPIRRCGASLSYLAGGALLPSGDVVLVLDLREVLAHDASHGSVGVGRAREGSAIRALRVLVADDSLTTRSLEQSVLEAAGYEVITAVDGLDAWSRLQDETVDLVVSDVEMPRMDGFELCRRLRSTPRTRNLPLVLVTGLETDDQRQRGLEAGADAYLGKSTFEQDDLLDVIAKLVGTT